MPDAIRTRCKFRVVGIECVEHIITTNLYEDTNPEAYAASSAPIWNDGVCNYKAVPRGLAQNVRLVASYDTANPEDVSFAAATPSGELKIYVTNPDVVGTFTPGKNYYLDLIPCE